MNMNDNDDNDSKRAKKRAAKCPPKNKNKFDAKQIDARLARVYSHEGDKLDHYDRWAAQYDADLRDFDYVGHLRTAEIFCEVASDKTAAVLDLGCGTGLAGETLSGFGYQCMDGADFSAQMLAHAARRGVYRALHQRDVTAPMQFDCEYDALISSGLFSFGIPHIDALPNAIAAVRCQALCVISVNGAAWREHDMQRQLPQLAERGGFVVEQCIETDYLRAEKINAQVLVIRRMR